MSASPIFKNIKINAYWSIKGKEDSQMKGLLMGNPIKGFSLSTHILEKENPTALFHQKEVIYGETNKGTKLTLFNNYTKGSVVGVQNNQEVYEVEKIYVGDWFPSQERILFKQFSTTISLSEDWSEIFLEQADSYEITFSKKVLRFTLRTYANKPNNFTILSDDTSGFTEEEMVFISDKVINFFTFTMKKPIVILNQSGVTVSKKSVKIYKKRNEVNMDNLFDTTRSLSIFSSKFMKENFFGLLHGWLSASHIYEETLSNFIRSYYVFSREDKLNSLFNSFISIQREHKGKKGKSSLKQLLEETRGYSFPFRKDTHAGKNTLYDLLNASDKEVKELKRELDNQNCSFNSLTVAIRLQWIVEYHLLSIVLEEIGRQDTIIPTYFGFTYVKDRLL